MWCSMKSDELSLTAHFSVHIFLKQVLLKYVRYYVFLEKKLVIGIVYVI